MPKFDDLDGTGGFRGQIPYPRPGLRFEAFSTDVRKKRACVGDTPRSPPAPNGTFAAVRRPDEVSGSPEAQTSSRLMRSVTFEETHIATSIADRAAALNFCRESDRNYIETASERCFFP
jgi:hypothetical protein